MPTRHHLVLVTGSTREGRICPLVVRWIRRHLDSHTEFVVDAIDLAAPESADRAAVQARLDRADAFVIVTPEYNHSYPAGLKEFIDAFSRPWRAKPVAVVSYGGLSGGIRATEHLRAVLAELHAVVLRDTVALPLVWEHVVEGELVAPAAADAAAERLLDRLLWWTTALAEARARTPYAA